MNTLFSRKLKPAEVSNLTGIPESTLAKMRMTPDAGPPFLKLGKTVLYDTTDVEAWLASKRRRSTSEAA
ncbi:DNA-binding protein [Metarhizobium album]|uniref:DNA-binding protein n=1 Tax=Metarhizobium album TaxID=2182425 RepID=A0A2U2DHH5_9HYPH|nr:helix-turn-helix domain-containing protein [Rhizobium album]PWE52766.1 DNA-binding protein [Rhizobium album]